MANAYEQLQQALKSKSQPAAAAAVAPVANFSDWLWYGQGNSIFASVTITPASSSLSISYALILLQTPGSVILCDAALSTSNAGNGWTVNIATGSDTYDLQQYGNTVQAYAFAQVYGVGDVWSPVQSYTVQP